jgi:hypothetical protein
MLQKLWRTALTLAIVSSLAVGPLAQPAAASTGSTLTIIEAAAGLIGGIILYNNYEHKKQAANSIVGYTQNGGTVYGDGRIVMPNGSVVYPNANGQYPWGQSAYYMPGSTAYAYDYQRTGYYDRTHRHNRYYYRTRDNDDYVDRDDSYRYQSSRVYQTRTRYVRYVQYAPYRGNSRYARHRGRDRDHDRDR